MRSIKPILLLEDDTVDAMTVKRAMKDLNVANSLVRAVNGEEGLKYLRDSANAKPCVILLDLNMPRMNGVEFLRIIKADIQLKGIPVVVLTTSRADQDKFECFDRGVAGYIVKPVGYQAFVDAMRILNLYWTLNELPGSNVKAKDVELEKTVLD
ncbi:MAG: response regulator [Sedimentisphaerales bacterium]|jgi:CheY-like chemotaxis protein